MQSLSIRPFQTADTETLRSLLIACFDGVSIDQNIERQLGPVGTQAWGWRKGRHLDDDIRRDPRGIFVALVDDRIVGFVSTWIDREASVGFIPNLVVHKDCRGHGIGRQLLEFALNRFREHGLSVARIETLDQNDIGRHLYPSVGFMEVARQIHFALRLDAEKP